MRMCFSTLFDSGYLDKGLVLLDSLRENVEQFRLYVFAFDDECYRVMSAYEDDRVTVIPMSEFESRELLEAKSNRNSREYCWTCSCHTIKYVLEKYNEEACTYIDADMYFYHSPQKLFEEITDTQSDVGIIRHGFIDVKENRRYVEFSGEYCVEFNTFYNNENGKKVLDWWCARCLECCSEQSDGIHFGDQKYIEQFPKLFSGIHVLENLGAGVAPWNIARFSLIKYVPSEDEIILRDKVTKKEAELIFYHFQQMRYISTNMVDINAYMYPHAASKLLRDAIYKPYLKRICDKRKELRELYQIDLDARERFVHKQSFGQYVLELIKYERNPMIFARRFFRVVFRKRNDYISW